MTTLRPLFQFMTIEMMPVLDRHSVIDYTLSGGNKPMRPVNRESGFTMIELLFVIVVIGVMLAVITPRAYRANIDAKYGVVRQGAVELTSYALDWANQGLASQDQELSASSLDRYMASLAGQAPEEGFNFPNAEWIARGADGGSNWNAVNLSRRGIFGRSNLITNAVQDMLSGNKILVNPFNGVSVFLSSNDPNESGNPVTGALGCGGVLEGTDGMHYYALVFPGTDSSTTDADKNPINTDLYAGQNAGTLSGLRNGIFLARER